MKIIEHYLSVFFVFTGIALAEPFTVTNLNPSGPGSLAEALAIANTNGTIDTIYFADGLVGELLIAGEMTISEPLDFYGPGADLLAISGGGAHRIFYLTGSYFGKIAGVTLRDGNAGGGQGGAILHASPYDLTLEAVHIENCSADRGGGVYSRSYVFLERSTISGCTAAEGGAVHLDPLDYVVDPFVSLNHATLVGNRATTSGGAVYMTTNTANLYLAYATLHDNRSTTSVNGDTIRLADGAPTHAVEMINSVVSDARIPVVPPATLLRGYPTNYALIAKNYIGSSARLRDLALHSGPVPVCMPELDSPLVDAATIPHPEDDSNNYDARFQGTRDGAGTGPYRDLGAVEIRRYNVTSTNDTGAGTLRAVITNVNQTLIYTDYIVLPPGVIHLTNALPVLTVPSIITGAERPAHGAWMWPRSALYTDQAIGLLTMSNTTNGHFNVEYVEFRGGRTAGAGAAVRVLGPGLTVRGCTFIENQATNSFGGAVSVQHPGPVQVCVEQSLFAGQEAFDGAAALYVANTLATGPVGRVTVHNSIFSENAAGYGSLVIETERTETEIRHVTFDANTRQDEFIIPERGVVSANGAGAILSVYNSAFTRNVKTNQTLAPSWFSAGTTNLAANHVSTNEFIYLTDSVNSLVGPTARFFPRQAYEGRALAAAADPAWTTPRDFLGVYRSRYALPDIGAGQRELNENAPGYATWIDAPCHPRERIGLYGPFGDIDGDGFGNGFELAASSDPFTPDEPEVHYYFSNTVAAIEVGVQVPRARSAFGDIYIEGTTNLLGSWEALNVTGYGSGYVPDGETFSGNYASVPHETPWHFHRATLLPRFILPLTPCLLGVGPFANTADSNGWGQVTYPYAVGAHEVTVTEYVQFLNAVDESGINHYNLWNEAMATNLAGSILRITNAPIGKKYQSKTGRDWFPVNYVTYYDALAYCNWMTAGMVEEGSYSFNKSSPPPANFIAREAYADYVLPTPNEWYKAAYFVDDTSPGGLGLYSHFPLRANSSTYDPPPGTTNSANLPLSLVFFPPLQEVGSYPSALSAVGAWDMAGNVKEMVQAGTWTNQIAALGGGYADSDNSQARKDQIGAQLIQPTDRRPDVGFRIIKLK